MKNVQSWVESFAYGPVVLQSLIASISCGAHFLYAKGGGCRPVSPLAVAKNEIKYIVKLQWLEHLWDHGNLFEIWVVRATES